jgi:multisubunit Na+/H+ antiporter MnhB subunit
MDSAVGEEKKKRSKVLDLLLLVGAGLIVAAASTAAFWMAEEHHISPGWLFAAGAALIFFLVVGWGYRRKFRDPAFVSFFLAWTLVHVLVFLLVLAYLGFLWYLPIMLLGLWVGYTIAIWQFGPPPDKGIR